ncbi:cyclin-I [Garra rufa]|uniref:cyclin-I n=1 Tax=Garra rufa TaxID=137080 RepID=UPI003CCE5BF6
MKPPGEEEHQRLGTVLLNTLAREMRLWRAPVLKKGCIQGSDISPPQYHEVIVWLREMSSVFQFNSETFALGVCVLNSLLATVKAQLKYLKCMAITSLILAAKINEEDEVIASVKDLLEQSRCKFSTAEILRMERVILNKLHWDLYIATPMDFIHIVSSDIESTEFICCKEIVDEYLTGLELSLPTNAVYILDAASMLAFRGHDVQEDDGDGNKKTKKGDQDMDDFYDGFWCLYDEDMSLKTGNYRLQDTQEQISPCPPLRPSSSQ